MRRLLLVCCALAGACTKPQPQEPACTDGLRATPARLLTRFELDNTLRDLVLDDTKPGQLMPVEPLALGLDNNADVNTVTADYQARLLDVAEQVAARAVQQHAAELLPCTTKDLTCGKAFIEAFGRRAFRRPLVPDERSTFSELFETALAAEGFDAAVETTLTAFLMAPQFLYRLEPFMGPVAVEPLQAHALASRLSYFLWGTMPDEALLASAETGALIREDELAAQTERMLKDRRATDPAAHFFSLYLRLDLLNGLEKDAAMYPAFTTAMRASWQRSIELYVGDVFAKQPTLSNALTSNALFVDENMGGMYGNGPVPAGEFRRLEMPSTQRAGLLTQPGFLARLSAPNQSSPVRRGVFVLEKVMCEMVAPPPPTVMAVPPQIDPALTTRERFAIHSNTAGCSGCHLRIDGIGFGFEHYDGIGAWRETDNMKPVDASGEVVDANEPALDGPYDGAPALLSRLSTSRQVHDCMATQWYRFAQGRVETEGDACSLKAVQGEYFDKGGNFDTLRTAVAKSAVFRAHAQEVTTP